MWDRVRHAHEAERPHATAAGREMIKEMVARRRAIARQQRVARIARTCCPETRLHAATECVIAILGLLTCVVFGVCVVMLAHLDNIDDITQNALFLTSTVVIFATWVGCLLSYACILRCIECLHDLEVDPDEA